MNGEYWERNDSKFLRRQYLGEWADNPSVLLWKNSRDKKFFATLDLTPNVPLWDKKCSSGEHDFRHVMEGQSYCFATPGESLTKFGPMFTCSICGVTHTL